MLSTAGSSSVAGRHGGWTGRDAVCRSTVNGGVVKLVVCPQRKLRLQLLSATVVKALVPSAGVRLHGAMLLGHDDLRSLAELV